MALKLKPTYDSSNNLDYLCCKTDKKLPFDYALARMLTAQPAKGFLPFAFEEGEKKTKLYYNITGTYTLKATMELELNAQLLQSLLAQVVMMFEECATLGFSTRNVMFDVDNVYVAQGLVLKFVYLPVSGYQGEDRAVLEFLVYLASNARIADEAGRLYAASVVDYLKRQAIFSLIDLKQYLGMEAVGERSVVFNRLTPSAVRHPSRVLMRDFVTE
jgi:hypothetical protein